MVEKLDLKDLGLHVLGSQTTYIITTDLKGKYTYLNPCYCARFQITPETHLGTDAMESVTPGDRERCLQMIEQCIHYPGRSVTGVLRKPNPAAKGHISTNFWEFRAITDENGVPFQILCLGHDISWQKHIEQEVKFKSHLLDTIGQAAVAFDLNGNVTYWNKAAERIYGYTKAEMLGQHIAITVHEQDPEEMAQARAALLAGKSWEGEQIHKDKEGRVFPVKIMDSPIIDQDGRTVGVIATAQDIGPEKRYQEHLKKNREQLDKLMQTVPGAVFMMELDQKGQVTFPYISRAISKLQGNLSPEKLKKSADPAFAEVHPEDVVMLRQAIGQAVASDLSELNLEYRVNGEPPGTYRWNRVRSQPEKTPDGKIVWYGIFEDIDKAKKASEEHQQLLHKATDQNIRLKDFSFMVSHNLRSSVSNLMGLMQMLRSDPGNPEYFEMLGTTADRLNSTLASVSELVNFENNLDMQDWVPCNLLETVTRVIELNNDTIHRKGIQFLVGIPDDLYISSVPAYLDSIFHNLITNAIKYGTTKDKKTIDIIAKQENGKVAVYVRDYGIGIDLTRHSHKIFKLGGRLHQDSRGEGLGLFMTKHQIEALGGSIDVESEEHYGSTFIVTFEQ